MTQTFSFWQLIPPTKAVVSDGCWCNGALTRPGLKERGFISVLLLLGSPSTRVWGSRTSVPLRFGPPPRPHSFCEARTLLCFGFPLNQCRSYGSVAPVEAFPIVSCLADKGMERFGLETVQESMLLLDITGSSLHSSNLIAWSLSFWPLEFLCALAVSLRSLFIDFV